MLALMERGVMMRKMISLLLISLMVCFVGCGNQKRAVHLPVPEYPLSKDVIEIAMEKVSLPSNLTIEENDCDDPEDIKSSSFTLRHPTKDLFAGHCLSILTHKADKFTSIGITVSSIDQEESFTDIEMEQAIRFATYLFWQDENDMEIYNAFMKDYVEGEQITWEKEIDGIDCKIDVYDSDSAPIRFQIAFSTNMKAQLKRINSRG